MEKPNWIKEGTMVQHKELWRGKAMVFLWGDSAVTALHEDNSFVFWSFSNLLPC